MKAFLSVIAANASISYTAARTVRDAPIASDRKRGCFHHPRFPMPVDYSWITLDGGSGVVGESQVYDNETAQVQVQGPSPGPG
jgi:hypothetical protein